MANAMLGLVAQRVVHANPVLVLLNNDSNDACTKVRMVKKRYTKSKAVVRGGGGLGGA